MAPISQSVMNTLHSFVEKIGKEIPIKKAILFGSYAKGNPDAESDVDLAIFSEYFEEKSRVEGITYLLMHAMEYKIDLEPIAFTSREYDERLGIVAEIINTGVEIPIHR
jgi:predicted nucleotidyltransferase